ncbi:MAG: hypothetical protein ACK5LS_01645 [Propioniciclava sp.]
MTYEPRRALPGAPVASGAPRPHLEKWLLLAVVALAVGLTIMAGLG